MHENWLFFKHTFSLKRTFNAALAYSSFWLSRLLKRPIVWGLPPVFMVEPTNICNLKCPLCPSGAGTLKRPGQYLDLDHYKKLIDELASSAFMVLLWNQGESFMHENFLEMVRIASDKGLWPYASTNGHYMDDPDAIVKSGLGTLLMSVDGASKETYETYRRSGNFDLVIENLKKLTAAKKRLKSSTPVIHLQFIIMRHNEHELAKIEELARECGVDRLTLKTVQIYDDADIDTWLPENMDRSRYRVSRDDDGQAHFKMRQDYPNSCARLWTQPVLNAGGEIAVCCFDKDSDFAMGHLKDQSFKSIWKSKRFMDFRRAIFKSRSQFEMCRNCGEGVKLNLEQRDIKVDLSVNPRSKDAEATRSSTTAAAALDAATQGKVDQARASRQRRPQSRKDRLAKRDGVAGMSMGQGPKSKDD
jgi:radical SAM protein with 4Fe4S-binding SPASM domain